VQAIGNEGTSSNIVRGVYQLNASVTIGTITFRANSAVLTAAAKKTLKKLAALAKAQGFNSLTINGHTAKGIHGSAAFRKRLSAARAAAVKTFLAAEFKSLHVRVRITVVAYGGAGATLSAKYRTAVIVLN
jgi:outer membrane protein OmpA-like peptidoglycan-associated protein